MMMFFSQEADVLKKFQCDTVRLTEESFCRIFAEKEEIRLFFINENEAFTDGRNIVVDPAIWHLYRDEQALQKIEEYLHWPPVVLRDTWNVLQIVTRFQTLHECLHLLYSKFPPDGAVNKRYQTRCEKKIAALIGNIIEDAYIEAVGASVYDRIGPYLRFGRIANIFARDDKNGTIEKTLMNTMMPMPKDKGKGNEIISPEQQRKRQEERRRLEKLRMVLNEGLRLLLYPMLPKDEMSEDVQVYTKKLEPLWLDGSKAASPDERDSYTARIFDIIWPLIPDERSEILLTGWLKLLDGSRTHNGQAKSIGSRRSHGKAQAVTTRLFANLDGTPKVSGENHDVTVIMRDLPDFVRQKRAVLDFSSYHGKVLIYSGQKLHAGPRHDKVEIKENHPAPEPAMRRAYQDIYKKYAVTIRTYANRFQQLLQGRVEEREERRLFGSGITSRYLSDPKKRYWYRLQEGQGMPNLSVLLLIDGSGSMDGPRRDAARASAVILHEVLKTQRIPHAIVEHRASFEELEMDVNVLVDFKEHHNESLNLMRLQAEGDNRDGLALLWSERYLRQHGGTGDSLMIVISDGVPCHEMDGYVPMDSIDDTAKIVRHITRHGTRIIAIALDDVKTIDVYFDHDFSCYNALKLMYPDLIQCTDLSRLPGQILGILVRLIK
ncbi:hypothetical protein [Mitsuokella sp.]|uniref:hypothetical protein n=1 Tax=Mitsuokella sp. TaxID=2049034 RepID=UPI003D7D18B4